MARTGFCPGKLKLISAIMAGLAGTTVGASETSKADIQIGVKAAAFVEPALRGLVETAILYDPSNPASKADADAIMSVLREGQRIKQALLNPRLVDVETLSNLDDTSLAFVSHGLQAYHQTIASKASGQGILTISSDMTCVDNNQCVIGVISKPRVLIVISKQATQAAGLGFKSAFLMMVRER